MANLDYYFGWIYHLHKWWPFPRSSVILRIQEQITHFILLSFFHLYEKKMRYSILCIAYQFQHKNRANKIKRNKFKYMSREIKDISHVKWKKKKKISKLWHAFNAMCIPCIFPFLVFIQSKIRFSQLNASLMPFYLNDKFVNIHI